MKYKFQYFFDIATSADSMQVINVSAGGSEVVKRCAHLFGAFKYFKLGKVSLKLVPASTLPVDPLGLSYEDDDPLTVDPRDQLNPGLVRITNGEDIYTDISKLTPEQQTQVYNAMMLDPRWYKWQLQSGMRRSAVPLFWQIGQLHQDFFPGAVNNIPRVIPGPGGGILQGTASTHARTSVDRDQEASFVGAIEYKDSDPRGLFQVGHRGRLGYLPTDALVSTPIPGGATFREDPRVNNCPEIQVFTIILPKANKTVYYYRAYVTEEVYFSGIRTVGVQSTAIGQTALGIRGLDQFLGVQVNPLRPQDPQIMIPLIDPPNNGGGNQ